MLYSSHCELKCCHQLLHNMAWTVCALHNRLMHCFHLQQKRRLVQHQPRHCVVYQRVVITDEFC